MMAITCVSIHLPDLLKGPTEIAEPLATEQPSAEEVEKVGRGCVEDLDRIVGRVVLLFVLVKWFSGRSKSVMMVVLVWCQT